MLWLRHAWDVMACSCGALVLSGRPRRPTVHWLSRPGGGWSELSEAECADPDAGGDGAQTDDDLGKEAGTAERRLGYRGYSRPRMAVPVEEIQPPVALTQASLASGT